MTGELGAERRVLIIGINYRLGVAEVASGRIAHSNDPTWGRFLGSR